MSNSTNTLDRLERMLQGLSDTTITEPNLRAIVRSEVRLAVDEAVAVLEKQLGHIRSDISDLDLGLALADINPEVDRGD